MYVPYRIKSQSHMGHGMKLVINAIHTNTREEKDSRDLSRIVVEVMHEGDSPSA